MTQTLRALGWARRPPLLLLVPLGGRQVAAAQGAQHVARQGRASGALLNPTGGLGDAPPRRSPKGSQVRGANRLCGELGPQPHLAAR